MTDLTDLLKEAMDNLAQKWRDYIMEANNVQPLSPITVATKVAKGSTYPDVPLVDTELMINSIESYVIKTFDNEYDAGIGIFDPARSDVIRYHEYGLGVPLRPTLRPVCDTYQDQLIEEVFDKFYNTTLKNMFGGKY